MYYTEQNCVFELCFKSKKVYHDPFNEITFDVVFTKPSGQEHKVPAFWAGHQNWKVRYSSPETGVYNWRSVCSDESNSGLHGQEGKLEIKPYKGSNPILKHGPVKNSQNKRYFEHRDGKPFLWLGDTWWMGLCKRLNWPGDFQALTADRVQKGFSVIQIVAGLYPDMPGFDERGANEAGFPWEAEYARINPSYFDMADLRIDHLVQSGLVPCIVGCWGYYLVWTGIEKMKQHWRYLIARYGAYPVVWCLAGEGTMPYYLTEQRDKDREFQKSGWTELGRYVREVDPYNHLVTIHPSDSARNQVEDWSVLDFDMLQTGHGDRNSIPNTIRKVKEAYERTPAIPVINGEVCYEGIGEACRQEVQRFMFWVCMLSGACGHTYGANGIWQVNDKDVPYGPSPHGMAWGNTPWDEAAQLPGSRQLGYGKKLLEQYEWWKIQPHPEWTDPQGNENNYTAPFTAGIPGELRLIFMSSGVWGFMVKAIERDVSYNAYLFSPVDGSKIDVGKIKPDENGDWRIPIARTPVFQDWVLIIEKI